MKKDFAVAAVVVVSVLPARADDCRERFARYLEATIDARTPGKAHIVTEIKGGPSTENEFLFVSQDHHMHKTLKPAGIAWTLTYKGAMYTSSDEGKTWKKSLTFDPAKRRAETEALLKDQAASARNTKCAEDVIDGRPHDTFDTELGNTKLPGMETQAKYWVDRESKQTTRTVSTMKGGGIESRSTQTWQTVHDLQLPVPQ